jgi:DNA excision repair protein ERCC-6-like
LFRQEKGGVLGDDMGLGKTVQICAYLKGLFEADLIKKVLVVVPATMKSYWQSELTKWCSGDHNIMSFEDKKKSDREQQLKKLRKQGGVLVTSFGMVTSEKINL